jgi:hypothetical protein
VLAAVKDKPSGRPPSGAVLDRRCARRPHHRADRDGRMAPPGTEQKNGSAGDRTKDPMGRRTVEPGLRFRGPSIKSGVPPWRARARPV